MDRCLENRRYYQAKGEADKIDALIVDAIRFGRSFRVEAGAGSGKTYSLNKAIEWIQENKGEEYKRKNQQVICITYTNAAVDVIRERIIDDSFIFPSTIHSFAWNAIKQYQSALLDAIKNDESLQSEEGDFSQVTEVKYTLGHRYIENGVHYLYHNDVLTLFVLLLKNAKFRKVFADSYPIILIDEYQDSYKPVIDCFLEFFIAKNEGPQFGFFGDAWQTIYQSNNACGLIENENLDVIMKGSNFRSAPKIVEVLNKIRPDLPQISAIDDYEGEVLVITCNDYAGKRRTDNYFKNDLPSEVLQERIDELSAKIKTDVCDETAKVLMITHKVLAVQQGYERLLKILADGLRDKQDPFLLFFMEMVEPVYKALSQKNMQLLFDTLKVRRIPITKKSEKSEWRALEGLLEDAREKRAIDVMHIIFETKLVPIPPTVEALYKMYQTAPDMIYANKVTLKDFLDLEYAQFLAAIGFLHPEAEFSTEHGVKGEEYDNVIFVLSKGWNQYQFEKYAPMIDGTAEIPKGKEDAFIRNRNLFYVCCSRARKKLILFISVPVDATFEKYLKKLVGEDNVMTYGQYLNNKK